MPRSEAMRIAALIDSSSPEITVWRRVFLLAMTRVPAGGTCETIACASSLLQLKLAMAPDSPARAVMARPRIVAKFYQGFEVDRARHVERGQLAKAVASDDVGHDAEDAARSVRTTQTPRRSQAARHVSLRAPSPNARAQLRRLLDQRVCRARVRSECHRAP